MKLILNEFTKDYISQKVGITSDNLINMSSCDIDREIEKDMHGKKLKLKLTKGMIPRGNIFIFLGRLVPTWVIDKKLAKI
ncbi:unnamed protein product [marine sediment metagenome]|uniref:Uncharacterized protein n=1 Tax=marine sediment metagenome TaxID=412755 RepID=X1FMK8_9ZZZZ